MPPAGRAQWRQDDWRFDERSATGRPANRIAVALLLDGAEAHPVWIVEIHETIVGVDDLTPVQAVCIGRNVRIDEFVHRIGKIHLPSKHVTVIEQHLEVNVRRTARIPTRIDRLKTDGAFTVGNLRTAEEFLADGRNILLVALTLVARINTLCICVPDIDAGAFAGFAGGAVDDPQIDAQRHARPAFGDLGADQSGVKIEGPLDGLRHQETDIAKSTRISKRCRARRAGQCTYGRY